jgi:hypothetical protein
LFFFYGSTACPNGLKTLDIYCVIAFDFLRLTVSGEKIKKALPQVLRIPGFTAVSASLLRAPFFLFVSYLSCPTFGGWAFRSSSNQDLGGTAW